MEKFYFDHVPYQFLFRVSCQFFMAMADNKKNKSNGAKRIMRCTVRFFSGNTSIHLKIISFL